MLISGTSATRRLTPSKVCVVIKGRGGGTISIEVSSTPEVARIDINDAGPGIAEGDRDRIFEPFYRGERQPQHSVKGTGIGLSIVQEYIAAHGGRIILLPSGPGARFRIELPRSP